MNNRKKKSTGPVLMVGPLDTAGIRYLTGFEAPDSVLLLRSRGRTDLFVSPLEAGRAGRCCARKKNTQAHTAESMGVKKTTGTGLLDALLFRMQKRRITEVRVGPQFPLYMARVMEKEGITVRMETGPLLPGREVKSKQEIRYIRQAQQAAVSALREAVTAIRAARIDRRGRLRHGSGWLTSETVRARIARVLLEAGCREEGTIVAGGRQAADPHERGHGPLRSGEPIVLDIFPRHEASGYWGDLTRTVARGRVGDHLRRMYEAVATAQKTAISLVAPRVSCRTIHRAVQKTFEKHGFSTTLEHRTPEGFIHGTGHGIGLEIHEAPSLREGPGRLRLGHVVTVEPGLYYRAYGGIRMEDTVVVSEPGAKILAPIEQPFLLDS
jgi:Xaa-Pro aminopeptidase